jgi:hypothetical protein
MTIMERERPFQVKKLMSFVSILVLLLFLSKGTVAYTPLPKGAAPLSSDARSKIVITSINGALQSVSGEEAGGGEESELVGVDTWLSSNNSIVISPQPSSYGCETQFETAFFINFTTANQLSTEATGAVNVTVFDYANRLKLATDILTLNFKPSQPASGVANFNIIGADSNPTYLVTITFPTSTDLSGLPQQKVPVIEYLLYRAGISVP